MDKIATNSFVAPKMKEERLVGVVLHRIEIR